MPQTLGAYLAPTVAIPLLGLTACAETEAVADAIARDQAKAAVNAAVDQRFPGVNARPITDCVIDNSSAGEILAFAANSAAGAADDNLGLLSRVLGRPDTQNCLLNNSLALLEI